MVGIGFGIFSIFGWLWAGLEAKSPKIWRTVLIWAVVTVGLVISILMTEKGKTSIWDIIGQLLLAFSWFGSFIHALIIRNTVLREAAIYEEKLSRLKAQHEISPQPQNFLTANTSATDSAQTSTFLPAPPPAALPPTLQVDMDQFYGGYSQPSTALSPGVPPSDPAYYETPPIETVTETAQNPSTPDFRPPHQPVGPQIQAMPSPPASAPTPEHVDINTASPADLLTLPTLTQSDVDRILAARRKRGGFRDINDLVSAAALQPHQLVTLQNQLVFSEFTQPTSQGRGRILDL